MDVINGLNKLEPIVILCSENEKNDFENIKSEFSKCTIISEIFQDISTFSSDSVGTVIVTIALESSILIELLKILKPPGQIIITKFQNPNKLRLDLTTNGFMDIKISDTYISATKPTFKIGSSVKLNLMKKPNAVWKIDDVLDDESETIDPDDLLDEEDFKKPDPSSLRVCNTTGKRKACKDCSCGLAEELNNEKITVQNGPKSSCGNCYLGDAFRCASCPYLGMPAFKPGEKVQLASNQLAADL